MQRLWPASADELDGPAVDRRRDLHDRRKLFYDFGMPTLAGLSYEKSNGGGVSVAAVVDAIANLVVDARIAAKGATLLGSGTAPRGERIESTLIATMRL